MMVDGGVGALSPPLRMISTQENKHGIGPDRNWAFGTNFLFQFEPVIRNPNDKRVEVFSTLVGPAVRIIQDGKKSIPIRCLLP